MITNEVSYKIWQDRYAKDATTPEENLKRVAKHLTTSEEEYKELYEVMLNKLFFFAGRTMSNAGIGQSLTLNNCFNLNHVNDSIEEIFEKVKYGALTQKSGGGTGYDFSKIRPTGTATSNDAIASGVVSFIEAFDSQTKTILQGGRRGANMGVLNIYHPDIEEFIEAKSYDAGKLTHFNLSVMVDDNFMNAVEQDIDIYLHWPVYDDNGNIINDPSQWKTKRKINARQLWDKIVKRAYDTGEPGVLFYDNMNNDNNLHYVEKIVSTNPCAEFVSGVANKEVLQKYIKFEENDDFYGACNLGSLFIHNFVVNPFTENASLDWDKLAHTIRIAVRYLDAIIDINNYPLKQYKNYQQTFRTIGLGVTGLADMLVMLNMKYGSFESIKFIDYLFEFISAHAYLYSTYLAKEKGSFPALDKQEFINSNFIQKHLRNSSSLYGLWEQVVKNIQEFGIRNARLISVAPTGTLSLTFGENCSSGIEPIFSLSYKRKIKMGGQDEEHIKVVDMKDYAYKLYTDMKNSNITVIENPPFVTALELTVNEHLEVLKAIAYHVDMNVSKTINIPTEYSFEDTKNVYKYSWKNKIKGCTIFRPNPIREGVLLTDESQSAPQTETNVLNWGDRSELPEDIMYIKRKVYIGCGKLKLFLGYSPTTKQIHDLYVIRSGQGGCEKNLQSVVILMSEVLRRGGNFESIEKSFEGVGACNSFVSARQKGSKLSPGSNCGTAILNEIKKFMKEVNTQVIPDLLVTKEEVESKELFTKEEKDFLLKNGEIAFVYKFNKCPVCGELIDQQEGCFTCKSCGWTKCS